MLLIGKSIISMAIFNSFLYVYQAGYCVFHQGRNGFDESWIDHSHWLSTNDSASQFPAVERPSVVSPFRGAAVSTLGMRSQGIEPGM